MLKIIILNKIILMKAVTYFMMYNFSVSIKPNLINLKNIELFNILQLCFIFNSKIL
jgi:hypothetical protein